MELTLKHNATLTNLNSRIEYHGEDRMTAVDLDLKIDGIPAGELDQFALDGNMLSTTLWENESKDDLAGGFELGTPKLPLLKYPLSIEQDFEKHKAVIAIESADKHLSGFGEVVILEAKVKKIKFTPKPHGLADVTLQVSGVLEGPEIGKIIQKYQGERCRIEIQPGEESQQTLLDDDASADSDLESDQTAMAANA